jgi:propionyl-CoA carboxylase alpha chain
MGVSPPATVERLLVANRGEIARRIFRTCRERGIGTVAVYADPDAGAPFVGEADLAVALGGSTPAETYLDRDKLIEAARRTGADAIHPGYGFLSEDGEFARRVVESGLIWIGPPAETIEGMGSKVRARATMAAAGVPVLPGVTIDGDGADVTARVAELGFPVLVKASAGGGGRGMRIVDEPAELQAALDSARHEAAAAFDDGTVFVERYVVEPRHLEVQILGDLHGAVVAFPERDCSLQRRHQKILEESPAPSISDDTRARLREAALLAANALGYTSAGTVEFVLTGEGEIFFLEVNTRLQVEHPVTELVCGVDLVGLQIDVAEGRALPPELHDSRPVGHAIEARIVAEDPAAGWLPQAGTIERFRFDPAARVDSGVEDGSEVTPHFDSMLAKVIVGAPTRAAAVRRLADVLRRAEMVGLRTNRDLLLRLLSLPAFAAGAHHTQLLDAADMTELAAPAIDAEAEARAAVAAALVAQQLRRASTSTLGSLPSGWRNLPSEDQRAVFGGVHGEHRVRYRLDRTGALELLAVGERLLDARLHGYGDEMVDLEIGGVRRHYGVARTRDGVAVSTPEGQCALVELPRFGDIAGAELDGALTATLPGAVLRVLVEVGDAVAQGEPLVVLEAMKMEHEIVANVGGLVQTLDVVVGDQVTAGQQLVVIGQSDGDGGHGP